MLFSRSELFFFVNRHHTLFFDGLNTAFSAFGRGDLIPLILLSLLLIPAFRNKNYISTTLIFGALVPLSIYLLKLFFNSPRPLKYYPNHEIHTVPWLDNLYETSFPSGHTIGAFGFFMLLSLYLPPKQKKWSMLFFLLALACAYSRMYLGQHFFADVYAGSLIGTSSALLVYLIGSRYIPHPEQQIP